MTDGKGHITRVNRSLLEMLGYERQELQGKMIADFCPAIGRTYECTTGGTIAIDEEYYRNFDRTMSSLFDKGKISSLQSFLLKKNNVLIPVEQDFIMISKSDIVPSWSFVTIRDTGSGISSDHLDHIFDPFFTTKEEGEGTGLGLSIVYGVVNNHKGKITVNSTEGEGTEFILTFPLLKMESAWTTK